MALCLSIFLEAISRFVEPQLVSNPKLVLGVGLAGLLSNLLGLFLFHEHSHSHGDRQEQPHAGTDKVSAAEQGNNQVVADDGGNVPDVLPQSTLGSWRKSRRTIKTASENYAGLGKASRSDDDFPTVNSDSSISARKATSIGSSRHHRHSSGSRTRFSNPEDMNVHPASFRSEFIAASASRLEDIDSVTGSESEAGMSAQEDVSTEGSPLLKKSTSEGSKKGTRSSADGGKLESGDRYGHEGHSHTQPKEGVRKGGDLNMQGIFLHVFGDALGNLGVIGSALIIWLTDYWWRIYTDPAISLVITLIILGSAIPLCKAASRILLQAVPTDINVDDIRRDINSLDGVQNCHHVHVWQLSDTKLIASLHIRVNCDLGEGSAKYMDLARAVSQCLHEHGIHSSTIQPEFLNNSHQQAPRSTTDNNDLGTDGANSRRGKTNTNSENTGRENTMGSEVGACLLECGDECDERGQCCAPSSIEGDGYDDEGHSH